MKRLNLILLYILCYCSCIAQEYAVRFYDDSDGLSQWHATKVLQDNTGMIWFSTWNGLNRFDGVDFDCFKVQPGDGNDVTNDRIRDFLLDKDGTFLCMVDEDIFRFDTKTCRFCKVTEEVRRRTLKTMERERTSEWGVPHNKAFGDVVLEGVHHEFVDRQGNTWLVAKEGIYKVSRKSVPFTSVNEVAKKTVRCMYRDRKGRVWISTKDDGRGEVAVFDAAMKLMGYLGNDGRLHPSHTPFRDIFSILHDKDGNIWLGSKPDGLFRINEGGLFSGKGKMEHFFPSTTIYDLKQNDRGEIWVATHGKGICLLKAALSDNPSLWSLIDQKSLAYPKQCDKVRRIIFHDGLMIASTTSGLLVVDEKFKVNHHVREADRAESLTSSATMDILLDKKGNLVVTTESGGINILQTKDLRAKKLSFRHITERNGLGSDVVHAAMLMEDGLLLQCNTELVKMTADYQQSLSYGASFWNADFRFSDARPVMLDDGRLLLSLEKGAIVVPASKLKEKGYVPRIAFTRINMSDGTVMWGADALDTLRLAPSQRNVTIKFSAIDYSADGDIRYATRLIDQDGNDDETEWTFATHSREMPFFNLAPGTYRFQVRSTNAEGMWTDNVRTLTLIVEPRFVETMAARILFFILLIAIIAGITYTFIYIKNINRQRRETLEAYLALLEGSRTETSFAEKESEETGKDEEEGREPLPEQQPTIINPQMSQADDAFMNKLMQFVEDNIGNSDASIDDMADATAMSRSSLARKMKQLLGVTPADFFKEARIKRAVHLLSTTEMSTSEVAYSCGFSDPKYFSKCFKATIGKSPKEVREGAKMG